MSTLTAQEVVYQPGPAVTPATVASYGGFAWGDVNGDGTLDVFTSSNNITLNNITSFTASTTATANIPVNTSTIGVLFADFNGDGVVDVLNGNAGNSPSLFIDSAGVFKAATATGDLATAGAMLNNFCGMTVADYNRDGNLDIAYSGAVAANNRGIWLLKGSASGAFTNVADGSVIDTSRHFEDWNSSFLDANNDGYIDLLMTSFRNGFSQFDVQSGTAFRKGSILYMNKGDGTFFVPTGATLARTIYEIDSISAGVIYTGTKVDTGIIVDDTVRHFESIAHTYGDFNNDGIQDLVLLSNSANNRDGNEVANRLVILYGKGDGTFTYKWNGANIVASNGLPQNGNIRAMDAGDYNNDTKLDILVAGNGVSSWLYRNNGDGTFTDVTSGDGMVILGDVVRSTGFVDYNKDGFLDIFAFSGSASSPFTLLQKNMGNTNHWIGFIPVGTAHNKSAIGAAFTLYAGGLKQIRNIRADGGAEGIGGALWANFGLGTSTSIDSIVVLWPDGAKQKWTGSRLSAGGTVTVIDKYWSIVEGVDVPPSPVTVRPSWATNDTSLTSQDTLVWHRVTGGTGNVTYQVQVATNSTFSTIAKEVSSLTDTTIIVRLGLSTKYYWRVRAFSAGFTGPWSAVDSFQTLVFPPVVIPWQISPANNAIRLSIRPTLVVSYAYGATTYHFQVDTVNRFTTNLVLNDSVNIFDTTVTIGPLRPNTKYYWRVRAWNPAGASLWSPVDSFTTMFVPQTPVLTYPTHNQANTRADTLILKWYSVDGDSNYVIQFWTSGVGGLLYTTDTTGARDTTLRVTSLMNRSKYYWRVMAFNQAGASPFSAIDSFTTIIEVPPSPSRPPKPSGAITDRWPTFIWSPAPNALKYHLQIADNTGFSPLEVETIVEDTTWRISDTLKISVDYYWRVSGINLGGEGAFSSAVHFIIVPYGVEQLGGGIPKEFALLQNYPNPFNPLTTIRYDIPKESHVKLVIYDVLGRTVATLVDGVQFASRYSYQWNPRGLSTGVYIYRIHAKSQDGSGEFTAVKKLLYMK